ncbi:MAG: hypothetical protein A2921_00530 [Candidatus Magasanikbacteria bacterium RIFCSPLOWO2_01_FULL_43_20b]|uniref:Vitamin K epoxide reductase domain-containing protein n=1 Tax=Candidatus Magasanikbacteria bacterium RIFCSPLOWO2_12_FULL_43_12 TaxID=1798692 RepID=A0A1F6MVH8_9BACT|nr:MAG: hypothetical protein A3C74_04055 [Candidatus Magasanikbacteria bacterium RIFCSPHIGHO2_02_FULL_44_13]OGH72346.1 MAG: hypothetical protein A3I93_04110 [Candidatus Magasanikbacteria bacterium RIFCSPLOWO2_02_FULL_43_22]OGH72899.1 MAG: hypothetical protein A2921_00530 [Candidatus Magasanikbacteria bacterium RIFCSPLOWO2_01_FULL_43_20b]OGH75669.1 MAG: hypothetical protein A3G00_04220 [Candidatus Magasanikbacteria bacterium RIFCSPLOWO2_12_FULL_43_12]
MTAYALLFTLAAVGLSETVYLIRKRMAAEKPVCLIGESCSLVLESKYSKLFGVHNDILGLLFYITALFISGFLVIGVEPLMFWNFIFKLSVAVGSLLSLFLTYLQWRVIKAWCFWCLMSAVTIWLMGVILIL